MMEAVASEVILARARVMFLLSISDIETSPRKRLYLQVKCNSGGVMRELEEKMDIVL